MLEHQDEVDEIAHAGVLTITEVARHRVELLGGVSMDVDDLDDAGRNPGEVEQARERDVIGVRRARRPRSDVELDAAEPDVGQRCFDAWLARSTCWAPSAILTGTADGEDESIAVRVEREHVDEALVQRFGGHLVVAKSEVEVLGETRVIAETDLERHPSLDHPAPGSADDEPGDHSLEDHAPAEPIERDAGL